MSSDANTQDATPTSVVTCFLLRRTPDGDEILLLRRSGRVRTYQGAWAGVSGYLEPGVAPLEQAYTEIGEETGLSREQATLLARGEPLPVHDAAHGLRWLVYPFLFEVDGSAAIHTDWETTESTWVAPAALDRYPTVPQLADALARVYPPPAPGAADAH
jgi:8-oxo-dGTP diphosphatase